MENLSGTEIVPIFRHERVANICIIVPVDEDRMFSLYRVLPAVMLIRDKIKTQIIGVDDIVVRVADSKCSAVHGPIEAFNFYRENQVSVFIGPVCDYSLAPVARYAPIWGIPVISPGGFAHDMSIKHGANAEFLTLTRIGVTFNSLSDFIVGSVLVNFQWTRVFILYDINGLSHVMPKFCYLAASSVANQTKVYRLEYRVELVKPDEMDIDYKLRTGLKGNFSSEFVILLK
ncbi:hypothetical protein Btru_058222 [Bulinus truncatus]|nr:hypothetical protein Btru_058222 [Bulinus truncatus]